MYTHLRVLRNRNNKKYNIFIRNKKLLKNVKLGTIFHEITVTNNRKLDKQIYINAYTHAYTGCLVTGGTTRWKMILR